jgi:Ca2+-binding RTX toxin-like protein
MALPVVEYLYGFPVLFPDTYFEVALDEGVFQPATETKLVLQAPDGIRIVFKGDFIVSGGVVTGGTAESFAVFASQTKVMKGSGFAMPATELIDAIDQFQLGNYDPLEDIFLQTPTRFVGSDLTDYLFGASAGTKLVGRDGGDYLIAQAGDLTLKGGKGNDLLVAYEGSCLYKGGQGEDVFVFVDPSLPNKIQGFSPDNDLFMLDPFTFEGVPFGFLADDQFKIGKHASTAEQIIIFQKGKGKVFYDQDGSGDTYQAVQFAKVDKGLDLSAQHFYGELGGLT